MAFSLVQSKTGSVGASNATSVTVTTTATGSGNLLVAYVYVQGSAVTITPPASWVQINTTQGINGGTGTVAMYYLPNSTSGVTSFVFSFSASCNAAVAFEEWSGVATSSPLDTSVAQANAISSTAATGTTSALAGSGELAVWGLAVPFTSVLTYSAVTNGYAEDTNANAFSSETSKAQATLFYNTSVGSAATSSGCTMSGTGGNGNTTILAVFKPSGSGVALAGTLAGVGTLAGTLSIIAVPLAGTLAGVGTLAGTLSTSGGVSLSATLAGTGTLAGTLSITPSALQVTIGGNAVIINEDTFQLSLKLDERWRCHFTVLDYAGTQQFSYRQQVVVTDAVLGVLFAGFVADVKQDKTNTYPDVTIEHQIDCIDNRGLVDKRTSNWFYANQQAGVIAVHQVQKYLASEGITAAAALRWDELQTDWAAGTLTNTVATSNAYDTNPGDGDLELAAAGTVVTILENTTANFSSGTLQGVVAASNTLAPVATPAIKLVAVCSQPGSVNAYSYVKIWGGSQAQLANDYFSYDIFVMPTSPSGMMGVDITFTDGTTWRDNASANPDVQFVGPHPKNDVGPMGIGKWYHRLFFMGATNGKTVQSVQVVSEGDAVGTYTCYIKNIRFDNAAFYFFQNTLQQTPQQLQNNGYSSTVVSVVNTYDLNGCQRSSPAYSINAANLLKNSYVTWNAVEPAGTKFVLKYSLDNVIYQTCTKNAPLPNLPASTSIAGKSIYFSEQFTVDSTATTKASPEVAPILSALQVTLNPTYNATKADVLYEIAGNADWASGTFTSTTNNAGRDLSLIGSIRNWDDGNFNNQTLWATNAGQSPDRQAFHIALGTNSEARSQMVFAGQIADGTLETDILVDNAGAKIGVVYRTSNWQTADGSFAYGVEVTTTTIKLFRGNNSSSGTPPPVTQVGATGTLNVSSGNWHRLKVVFVGSSHKLYLDDVLYVTATDATYTTGYTGLRISNTTGAGYTAFFDNFGVMPLLTGTWVSANQPLAGAGTYGNSVVSWRDVSSDIGVTDTLLVETQVDGSTWQTATNGSPIPNLTAGQNLAAVNLKVRITLTTTTASTMPSIDNLIFLVLGSFSASGTRVSPALSLAPVGSQVGTTLVNWNANLPTNTGLTVATSINGGSTYQTVAAAGNAITGITTQAALTSDSFTSNTSANYTSTFGSGGSASTWTWDTANSRLVASGGATGLLLYSSVTASDVDVLVDMDQSDFGGICFRHVDATHYYVLAVRDASSPVSGSPNSMQLYKANGGAETAIGPTNPAIRFVRGIPHRIRVTMIGGVITVYFDGAQILTYTDGSPLGAGTCGMRNDTFAGASASRYYQFRLQPLGQNVSALSLLTKVTLTSTDPTVTPQLLDMQAFVSSPAIGAGVLMATAAYNYTFVDKNFDDLGKQSNYGWFIGTGKDFNFQGRQAVPAPWVLSSNTLAQPSDLEVDGNLLVENAGDLYRNRQILTGVIGTSAFTDPFNGDGKSTSFTLRYPVAIGTIPTITLNGQPQTVGLQGASGSQWYYAVGSTAIAQDSSGVVLTAFDTLVVTYTGTYITTVTANNTSAQTALAATEGGSGIIEAVENVSTEKMTYAAAVTYANQLLIRYCISGRTLTYKTYRNGLAVGQSQSVFIPEEHLQNIQLLIRQIDIAMQTQPNNTVLYNYLVVATELPNVKSWSQLFASGLLN